MNLYIYIQGFVTKLNMYNRNHDYTLVDKLCWGGCQIKRDGKTIMVFDYNLKDIHITDDILEKEAKVLDDFVHKYLFSVNGYYTPSAMVKGELNDYDHSTHESMKVFDLSKEIIKLNNYFAEQGYTVSSAKKVAKDYLDKADSQKVTKLEDD